VWGIAALVVAWALVCASPAAASEWTQRALDDQYELGSSLPMVNAPWVGTHNSFNSTAEMGPALSAQDSNQRITLRDQLDAGVRSLELDLHWFPSATAGGWAPVVCHATGEHLGCTVEKPLAVVLDDIADWLRSHPDQALLLYLEDHLDNEAGYDAAAAIVESRLGDVLHRPAGGGGGGGCVPLPLDLTRDEVRGGGGQVVIVSNCGAGAAWPAVAFNWRDRREEEGPLGYRDFPDCGPHFTRADYDTKLIRYFEDSTRLSATVGTVEGSPQHDGITVAIAAAMARCGVDLLGFDQLTADDPRLDAVVWSWAPGEPRRRGCAAARVADGRWQSLPCTRRLRVACRDASGAWSVPRRAVRVRDAARVCASAGAVHDVPRTGYEAQTLRLAMERAGASRGWLNYRAG
jgi:hypothetical protein